MGRTSFDVPRRACWIRGLLIADVVGDGKSGAVSIIPIDDGTVVLRRTHRST
jgi:hypothetical protein